MGQKIPVTPAIRALRDDKVDFEPFLYRYEEKGGAAQSARELGKPLAQVVKTLILEDDRRQPLVALMTGDREVSTKSLARLMGVKTVQPCKPEVAQKHSGYLVGGTSPFGLKKAMPIFMERGVLEHDRVYINGGKRGFLVGVDPREIVRVLEPTLVEIGVDSAGD